MEITIQKSEYDELIKAKSENESLKKDVEKYQEESTNKSKAIDEARKKNEENKKTSKAELEIEKEKLKNISEKLWLEEWEDPLEKIEKLKNSDSNYSKILEKEKKERTERIEKYKEKLWEDFMKEKEELFEWLNEEKQERFLKEFIDAKGLWDDEDNTPSVSVHKNWDNPSDWKKSNFDKLADSGAESNELFWALASEI